MTFELTPELDAHRQDACRVAATVLAPAAAEIDRSGRVPDAIRGEAARLVDWGRSPLAAVVAAEELAATSAAAAAAAIVGPGRGDGLAGLRGVPPITGPTDEQTLGMAAVCVGIGRAALAEALALLRTRGDRPSGEPDEPPHWVLADAATGLDAARLLVHASAEGQAPGAAAALVFAGEAAMQSVDAAVRIVGPAAYAPGSTLERCSRDARAARLLLGTEDEARAQAAARLLD
jgi:alkylation response protein AidB-like acyl-CoA dehydrogenase